MDHKTLSPGIVEITCGAILAVLLGYLVIVGKALLLPIIVGIISAYILITAAERLGEFPVLGRVSPGLRRALVGLLFVLVVVAFVVIVSSNAHAISAAVPTYVDNLSALINRVSDDLGFQTPPDIAAIIERLQDRVDIGQLINSVISGLASFGTFVFTALLYAGFLLSDWGNLPEKTKAAFGRETSSDTVLKTARKINGRIGAYLAAKTLINLILAAVSLGVMLLIGIEFAFFWAVLIALLNYIPYIGSIVGVMFPVALALAQFGTIFHPAIAFIALMGAQTYVGNVLEPKMLGRSINMSAFVFLVALSFWMTVWGLEGAILAIPLTSMIMIVLAEIPQTRPLAVLMSDGGDI